MNFKQKITSSISIYVHWPYCLSKCPYCDFNSHILTDVDYELWLTSYEKEIEYFYSDISGKYIRSIFFGGGTPSLMSAKLVEGVIEKINKIAIIDLNTEITLEANPTSFEINKFKNFKESGINRVSIGVQSLIEDDLKKLGRTHSASESKSAIINAASIFPRISFDLIYARSGQTLTTWQLELKEALELAKGHISLYQLTIEKGTPFYKQFHDGIFTLPSQNESADMYEWTTNYLQSHNYNRYEISNYAQKGLESKHNLAYWQYNSYIGIGPGAHSRVHRQQGVYSIMMLHKPSDWIKSVSQQGHGIQKNQFLLKQEIVTEIFMMGLRLKEGLNNYVLKSLTGLNIQNFIDHDIAKLYSDHGFLKFSKNNIMLTDKGLMLHNYILPRILSI